MSNENNSIYTTLMKPDDLLGEDKIKKEARDLIVNYFALGEQQSLQIKEQLKAKASYNAMAASNALSGATAGVLTRIIDSAAIGASIGSAIPIVGTAAGYAVGKSISKIPGVKAIMKEGSLEVDHSSVQRWVVEYSPQLAKKFASHKKSVGKSWRMDETYIKVKGGWHYLYRAVEKVGQTIDFYLSKHRDAATAKRFFQKAIRSSGKPEKVNKDKSGSNTAALNNINRDYKANLQIKINI